MQHFYEMCEGPIHYLQLFLRETVLHMVSWVFCTYMFICAGLRQLSRVLDTQRTSCCTCVCVNECGWSMNSRVHACTCLLLFIVCSIFCITQSGTQPSTGAVKFPSNRLIPQWLFRVSLAVLSVLLSVPDQKTGPLQSVCLRSPEKAPISSLYSPLPHPCSVSLVLTQTKTLTFHAP